ncbi:polymeric immunoglobulin receptor-like isoform X1 [Girardinichthys multiradiatus]|uniref:polymeric immunoglobulin receptor-like isoform X1 n=1 Tax=Girardinichthys multiradiatus TaxID=208333 RepID=UPI001FAC9E11|nr:polymeric immunoglobulin receptor-like isoform X1 [Girardinichthys multiradiatus]
MWSCQHVLFIICTLNCVSGAASLIHVFGYEGKEVKISCPYIKDYESFKKYLCKNGCGNRDVLITTLQRNTSKYLIYDDTKKTIITVTISDLRSHDAGKYWCGVTRLGKDLYTEVKLEVKKDRCCNTVSKIQSIEEGSVSISCPYDSESVNNLKYICRGNRPSTCLQQAVITSDTKQKGRLSFNSDTNTSIFKVTISKLTLRDSGPYLCGVQRNSGVDVFSAVELEVKKLELFHISGIVGHPVTLQCPNPPEQRDKKMFLCKGDQHNNCTDIMENRRKFMLHNVSSSCFSVTITDLEAADAGTYYCGSDSQLSYIKIQLTVVSTDQSSTVSPIITDEQITSLTTSPHLTDVTLFYILPAVLALLLILVFLLWMVLKYKSRSKKVDGVGLNVLNSDVGMISNDIYELQENAFYMNISSPPNMSNHHDIYSNILYRNNLSQLGNM